MKKFLAVIAILSLVFSPVTPAFAATYYWDTDGATAGFGSAAGTWGTDTYWSTSSAGTAVTADPPTTTGDAVNFGTATLGIGAPGNAVAVNGTVAAQSITFGAGQTDAVTISGGTAINMAAAATVTVNNTTDTISTSITGGGTSFTKEGNGTLVLSGTNTFTGLTINNGILKIGSAAALGTEGWSAFVNSGGTLDLNGKTVASGQGEVLGIAGTGEDGNGALQNTTGDAVWDSYNVYLADAATIGVSAGATLEIALNGVTVLDLNGKDLTVAGAGDTTISRVISDTPTGGSLTKDGAGTLTLTAVNTYTGATNVNEGTLVLGADVNVLSSSTAVTVATGATLDIGGYDEDVGSIAGGGFVTTNGDDAVFRAGSNDTTTTFSGVIKDGTLGEVMSFGKLGSGTLTLSGVNIYTGATTIAAGGALVLDAAGTIATSSGVTNSGTFTIEANKTIAALAGAGTTTLGLNKLTITGTCAVSGTGQISIDLNSDTGTFGSMASGSTATIPATVGVNVNVLGTGYIADGTTYMIVDGTGGTGVAGGNTVTDNSPYVSFTTTGGADLLLVASRSGTGFSDFTTTPNATAAAEVLETAGKEGATGDMKTVLDTLENLPTGQIENSVSTMTPDVSSGAAEGSRNLTANALTMISNRLGGVRHWLESTGISSGDTLDGVGVWLQGLGSHMKQDERKGIEGYQANLFGTSIGADKLIDRHFRVGLAGSYGFADVNSKQPGRPSDSINSWQATLYGSYDSLDLCEARKNGKNSRAAVRNQGEDLWYVDGMLAFTNNDYDSRREIWLTPTSARVAKADHYGQQYSTNFEAGYTFVFGDKQEAVELTPFVSLGYNYLYMNKYKEKGAGALNLNVDGEGFHQLEQGLGTKLAYPIVSEKAGTFIPSVKAAWLYDYMGDRFITNASFQGGGPSFETQGAKPAKNGMLFGAELAFLNKGNMTVTGNWDIELKDQFASNTYYGTVRYDF